MIVIVFFARILSGAENAPSESWVTIGTDGNFLTASGKPMLLLGAQAPYTATYENIFMAKKDSCPSAYEKFYHEPMNHDNLKTAGFNTMCLNANRTWMLSLLPDYGGFRPSIKDWKHFDWQEEFNQRISSSYKSLSGLRWNTKGLLAKHLESYEDIRMPIYVEIGNGMSSFLFRNKQDPEIQTLIGGATAFAGFDHSSSFALGFSLATSEGMDVYRKMMRFAAEEFRYQGANILAYELFNEPKYNDSSIAARKCFTQWLKNRYGYVKEMNRTYGGSTYNSFEEASYFPHHDSPRFAPLDVDWSKFMQELVVNACVELKKSIREIDPSARFAVQDLGMQQILQSWHNFDVFSLARQMDVINTGTGGYSFYEADYSTSIDTPFMDTPPVGRQLRASLLNSHIFHAISEGKPMLDGEMYTGPTYDSLKSRLWSDVIRGHNAVYLFSWCGSGRDRQMAGQRPYQLLNQNYFKAEDLSAIRDTRDEIELVSDIILPRGNRSKAETALLISRPTIRYEKAVNQPNEYSKHWYDSAVALTFSHFSFDALFEAQLPEKILTQYRVIFANNVPYIFSDTNDELKRYVENGGIVVANGNAMQRDEYGQTIAHPLFRLEIEAINGAIGRLQRIGAKAKTVFRIKDLQDWAVVDNLNGKPAIIRKQLGTGLLYYIAAELPDYSLAAVYRAILSTNQVSPVAEISYEESGEIPANVELHRATNNGISAWYFMNCDPFPKVIRATCDDFEGKSALDPYCHKSLTVEGDSLTVLLEPHKRTLVISGMENDLVTRFGRYPDMTKAEMIAAKNSMLDDIPRKDAAKTSEGQGRIIKLDEFCNSGFDNQQNWPTDSAWFDEKHKYLVGVPWHRNDFGGVCCEVIRMDFNNNKTCIALKSKHFPEGLQQVENIPIEETVRSISFFHAVTYGRDGDTTMIYRIFYRDGSVIDVPIIVGKQIGDWNIESNNEKLQQLVAWKNEKNLGFFRWDWQNPNPYNEISHLSVFSANGEETPILVGITTHEADKQVITVAVSDGMKLERGSGDAWRALKKGYELYKSKIILTAKDGVPIPIPVEQLNRASFCFSLRVLPDQWGNFPPLDGIPLTVEGTTEDGIKSKSSAGTATDILNMVKSKVKESTAPPGNWVDISIPLKLMLNAHQSGRIVGIEKLIIWSHNNTGTIQIRELRFEYEK